MNTTLTALLTDLYQLTMAAGYWKHGMGDREAVFHLFFRKAPFDGGYSIAAGLSDAVRWLEAFRFTDEDVGWMAALTGRDGKALFEAAFLDHLRGQTWRCDVDAIPEGTVVFPHQPLVRVRGPILQAQIAETALLNILNYQTLIATKAARVCRAARGEPVLEFGLRRAQGPNGAVSASRAAYIGGCAATSNVLAGKLLGIPVRGTHAHSWVMSFADEEEAFGVYAEAQPNNCVFLVDTYDTVQGVRNAIEAGRKLRAHGHDLAGIRLDSGDLAWLSKKARELLDEAGFPKAAIIASNDLDEHLIEDLKQQGAAINTWGVGTRLVTGGEQGALGGVYKLGALRNVNGEWQPRIKLSEQVAKTSIPGVLQVRRFRNENGLLGDAIFDEAVGCPVHVEIVDPADAFRSRRVPERACFEDLLVPVFRSGQRVGSIETLDQARERCRTQLEQFDPAVLRLKNPHAYPAGIERDLADRRIALIQAARNQKHATLGL